VRLEIEGLSDRFDSEYFRLQNEDKAAAIRNPEGLVQFRKARAAAALAFALSSAPEALPEALYEAVFAADDQAGIVSSVEPALCEVRPTTG
jgi:hypothetical protein